MTAPIDAQMRRGLIEIEKGFDNSRFKLELAKAYDETVLIVEEVVENVDKETILDVVVKETEKYQNTPLTKEDLGNIMW